MKPILRFTAICPIVLLSALTSEAIAEPSPEIKRLIDTFEGRWSVRETRQGSHALGRERSSGADHID